MERVGKVFVCETCGKFNHFTSFCWRCTPDEFSRLHNRMSAHHVTQGRSIAMTEHPETAGEFIFSNPADNV